MNDTTEQAAERIAARGRGELLARLRPAFEEAAAAHADVLELNPDQLEEMVQRAADRADGLQWRRALAAVATEELGISLGEALGHPAVERAQVMVGAPSYEESLARLGPRPEPGRDEEDGETEPEEEAPQAAQEPEPIEAPQETPAAALAREEAHEPQEAPEAAHEPEEPPQPAHDPEEPHQPAQERAEEAHAQNPVEVLYEDEDEDEDEAPTTAEHGSIAHDNGAAPPSEESGPLRLAAVHLGGIANLAPAESDIQLEFSEHGLDVIRGSDTILGRLGWEDIRALEVPDARGWRRRRREQAGHLVVRTDHGDASFEIPGLTSDDLRDHLEPVRKYMPA